MANAKQSFITDYDIHLLAEGTHYRSYEKLGAHLGEENGKKGVYFTVWAPNARSVSVVGDFNSWEAGRHSMSGINDTGMWSVFVPGAKQGDAYKYHIDTPWGPLSTEKVDPYAFYAERPPKSASVVWSLDGYEWGDSSWMAARGEKQRHESPISIYELHLGSWKRKPEEGGRYLTYREMADELPAYVKGLGFTHVELLPITEHPFDGSWGYQPLGYFAPTSRFGTPQDFMYLVDRFHQEGIGVLVDWVPGHFPTDAHGLGVYDGTHLYEHADMRKGFHPDWQTYIFNYGRHEVANFLLSSALFWLDKYHIDGLRVDAVASMLYLDYSRNDGEWIPNEHGGRENLEAIHFLRRFNETVYYRYPDVMTVAEESTAWPMVSRPTYLGGLGFGFKWNMGWMNDILSYISKEPIHRSFHHNNLTFGLLYAFHENFILPLSHDEVVHGKGSLLGKMPGDEWQKFANLRLLYGFMYGHPGKKLLFMGAEIAQWKEWDADHSLDWHLLEYHPHRGVQNWLSDLNFMLTSEPALYEKDFDHEGFRWIDCQDAASSVVSFLRFGQDSRRCILCICNFTPVPREHYRIGVPHEGYWEEILNSDAGIYGGSGIGNLGGVLSEETPSHDLPHSISLTLPPLSVLFFRLAE